MMKKTHDPVIELSQVLHILVSQFVLAFIASIPFAYISGRSVPVIYWFRFLPLPGYIGLFALLLLVLHRSYFYWGFLHYCLQYGISCVLFTLSIFLLPNHSNLFLGVLILTVILCAVSKRYSFKRSEQRIYDNLQKTIQNKHKKN